MEGSGSGVQGDLNSVPVVDTHLLKITTFCLNKKISRGHQFTILIYRTDYHLK